MQKYQIGPMPAAMDESLAAKLRDVELATIGHFRHRGFVHKSLTSIAPVTHTLVGTAVTVAIPGTDSTLLHHAVGLLRPGDILLIDRLGDERHACLGGGVANAIKIAGAVAVILDGPCTDPHEITEHGLPVWCRGVSSITTRLNDLGGSLNKPIAIGNVPVMPGDVVIADMTGVIVMPADEAEEAADEALMRQARSTGRMDRVRNGEKLGDMSGATKLVNAALTAG